MYYLHVCSFHPHLIPMTPYHFIPIPMSISTFHPVVILLARLKELA